MTLSVTFNKRTPIYLQVMQHFKRQIIYGELKAGEEMPSRRQLANQLKINPNTVQRAFSEMEEDGLIYTEPNRPSRVTADPAQLKLLRKEWLDQTVADFVSAVGPIDVPLEEIMELIEEKMHLRKKEIE